MATFLIIDDEPVGATALANLLRLEGHQVAYAQTAPAALEHLRRARPDLILLDLTMPRIDGLDILDALGQEPEYIDLRIVIYSSRDDDESITMARDLGASGYIHKGLRWDETYERIRACLPA